MWCLCSPLAVLLLALPLLEGAQENVALTGYSRIIGGQDAKKGQWPWQVSVQKNGRHICGGSLFSAQWVVSAAHCFSLSLPVSVYQINLGAHQLSKSSPTQNSSVRKIIIHPNYNQNTSVADIALVQLKKPVTFTDEIRPISLPGPSTQFPAGENCMVTDTLKPPQTLQELKVPLVDVSTCKEYLWKCKRQIQESMMCTWSKDENKGPCKGDSGGPLACPRNGSWVLAGIVSWGINCTAYPPPRPAVYVRVSAYVNWIQEVTGSTSSLALSPTVLLLPGLLLMGL